MGLFRRGTKLLRLGSGLRDCCCRPEKPEECWCPSLCSYYVVFDGLTNETVRDGCLPDLVSEGWQDSICQSSEGQPSCTTFGEIEVSPSFANSYKSVGGELFPRNLSFGARGLIAETWNIAQGHSEYNSRYSYTFHNYGWEIFVQLYCGFAVATGKVAWFIHVRLEYTEVRAERTTHPDWPFNNTYYDFEQRTNVVKTLGSSGSSYGGSVYAGADGYVVLYGREEQGSLCGRDLPRTCPLSQPTGFEGHFHLPDTTVNVTADGVTATVGDDTKEFAWTDVVTLPSCSQSELYGFPVRTIYTPCDDFLTVNTDHIQYEASFKKLSSCQPGDCDCDVDLTGSTVVFEGKTFTYGSLEEFVSEDGVTRWSETLTGVFVRVDYDTCDPSQFFPASTVTAEVFCITEDGQDYWGVALVRQCAERSVCQASTDAERTTQWSGFFDCAADGKPTGAAHALGDGSQPPDLDTDVTSGGVLSGDCVGDPAVPSISFS